jgi:hypothetical protein
MSHIKSYPRSLSPSLKGSRPVAEVLNRIPTRDSHTQPFGSLVRWTTDDESTASALHVAALAIVTALVVGSLWLALAQTFASLWNSPGALRPVATESLSIPEGLHIAPMVR